MLKYGYLLCSPYLVYIHSGQVSLQLRGPDQLIVRNNVQLPQPEDAGVPRRVLHPGQEPLEKVRRSKAEASGEGVPQHLLHPGSPQDPEAGDFLSKQPVDHSETERGNCQLHQNGVQD